MKWVTHSVLNILPFSSSPGSPLGTMAAAALLCPRGWKVQRIYPHWSYISPPPYSSETHPLLQYTYRLLPPLMVNNGLCVFLFCNKDWNSTLWRLVAAESPIKRMIHLCSLVLLVYNNGFPKLLFKLLYLCSQRKINNWSSLKEIDFMCYKWNGTVACIGLCVQVSIWQRRTEESWCASPQCKWISLAQDAQPEYRAYPPSCPQCSRGYLTGNTAVGIWSQPLTSK